MFGKKEERARRREEKKGKAFERMDQLVGNTGAPLGRRILSGARRRGGERREDVARRSRAETEVEPPRPMKRYFRIISDHNGSITIIHSAGEGERART
jgi:hypothetical protein